MDVSQFRAPDWPESPWDPLQESSAKSSNYMRPKLVSEGAGESRVYSGGPDFVDHTGLSSWLPHNRSGTCV